LIRFHGDDSCTLEGQTSRILTNISCRRISEKEYRRFNRRKNTKNSFCSAKKKREKDKKKIHSMHAFRKNEGEGGLWRFFFDIKQEHHNCSATTLHFWLAVP
jgi:ribonuclease BN (tRNA processing enzyme)